MALTYNLTPYRRPMPRGGFRGTGSNMLFDLNKQINRLFDDFFDGDDDGNSRSALTRFKSPPMDIAARDEHYEMSVELPGVDFKDIELNVADSILTVTGEKKSEVTDDDRNWTEREYGSFQRRIQLPQDVDESTIEAEFENGVLTIAIPRVEEEARGRRIEVKNRKSETQTRLIDDKNTKLEENA